MDPDVMMSVVDTGMHWICRGERRRGSWMHDALAVAVSMSVGVGVVGFEIFVGRLGEA